MCFFFFSSRRRHTRFDCDWSSDVCSSDLKCLGLLALPLITLNGLMRSANNPLGNALEHFCGYNYQHHTLDKFLRELKYLVISDRLLRAMERFWTPYSQEVGAPGMAFLCFTV